MVSKKNIIVLILVVSNFLSLIADDGSWSKSFTIDGGSIYSENDNSNIELVKEILIFNGEYTKAVFQFKNTSSKAVTIECGFPVQYEIDVFFGGDSLEVEVSHYAPDEQIPVLEYLETLPYEYTDPDDSMFGLTTDIILNNIFNNSREFISPDQTPEDLTFNIKQDGNNVYIEKVLVERYAGEKGASVTFHYKHNLYFKPGELSTVIVEYTNNLFHGSDGMSDVFKWNYVIGTGGTWKGKISEFYLIKPKDWQGELTKLDLIWENTEVQLYYSDQYEPSRNDMFSLRGYSINHMEQYEYFENELPGMKEIWNSRSVLINQPKGGDQNFVKDIIASSFLPDKLPVFTKEGVVLKAGFSPVAAFDGLPETSWCENVKGDGIDEFIELTITKDVWGLSINNGFTRIPVEDWLFDITMGEIPFEDKMRDDYRGIKDYFTQNNRVKKLAIRNSSGETLYNINLEDQRNSQTFPGIRLSPGRYRFVIKEVYPGTKWQDTCIGEIIFHESENNQQMDTVTNDQFYTKALKGVIFK